MLKVKYQQMIGIPIPMMKRNSDKIGASFSTINATTILIKLIITIIPNSMYGRLSVDLCIPELIELELAPEFVKSI